MNFRCNFRKCRKELSGSAIVTSCLHIFCFDHNPANVSIELIGLLKTKNVKCLVCKSDLNQNFDCVEVELQPSDAFKGMVLTGLRPETIIEITSRALGFWIYQMEQELKYGHYINKKQFDKVNSLENEFLNVYKTMNDEKNYLRAEKENLNKECEELREKLIIQARAIEALTGNENYNYKKINTQTYINENRNVLSKSPLRKQIETCKQILCRDQKMPLGGKIINSYAHKKNSTLENSLSRKNEQIYRFGKNNRNQSAHLTNIKNLKNQENDVQDKFISPLDKILNNKFCFSGRYTHQVPNDFEFLNVSQTFDLN